MQRDTNNINWNEGALVVLKEEYCSSQKTGVIMQKSYYPFITTAISLRHLLQYSFRLLQNTKAFVETEEQLLPFTSLIKFYVFLKIPS